MQGGAHLKIPVLRKYRHDNDDRVHGMFKFRLGYMKLSFSLKKMYAFVYSFNINIALG